MLNLATRKARQKVRDKEVLTNETREFKRSELKINFEDWKKVYSQRDEDGKVFALNSIIKCMLDTNLF